MAEKKTPKVSVELAGADVLAAYNAWVAAKAAIDAATEAKEAAERILHPVLDEAGAEAATIAGQRVINRVKFDRLTLDAAVVKKLAPRAFEKASKFSPVVQLRKG